MKKSAGVALLFAGCLVGCSKEEPARREPPPPVPTVKAAACAGGGRVLEDAESARSFPRTTGGFCIDPNGSEKAYGDDAKEPLEKIRDLMDGECEVYFSFGARRVVELRYVDGAGSPATIDVHFSKYASTEGAYGMFTKRVVADGDPAGADVPKPLPGPGQIALGKGIAYVWRGPHLVELTYADENAAEAGLDAAAKKLLPPLASEIANKLPGDSALPPSALALPKEGLLPLGVRGVLKDALGVRGIGGAAVGYYAVSDKRFRVIAFARPDADQAKDVLAALSKVPGASKEKGVGEGAVRAMLKDGGEGAREGEWVLARFGSKVLGVGDEPLVKSGPLSKEEKIERLKKLGPT